MDSQAATYWHKPVIRGVRSGAGWMYNLHIPPGFSMDHPRRRSIFCATTFADALERLIRVDRRRSGPSGCGLCGAPPHNDGPPLCEHVLFTPRRSGGGLL